MQVTNTTNSAAHAAAATDPTAADSGSNGTALQVGDLANTSTFLQLLVAQIKNQDPLQPTDSIQFVTQLAQFSSLEQLIGIRGELGNATTSANNSANKSTAPTS